MGGICCFLMKMLFMIWELPTLALPRWFFRRFKFSLTLYVAVLAQTFEILIFCIQLFTFCISTSLVTPSFFQCYNVGEENLQTLCLNVCVCVRQLECDIKNIQRSSQQQFSQSELISLNNILFLSVCQVIEQLKKVLVWLDRWVWNYVQSVVLIALG